ncbi:MAG: LysR family transcriptional regulator [Pararhodobacter sp.]|nr:LysR family transcriptional regulator [Pararhodobacter sp.]
MYIDPRHLEQLAEIVDCGTMREAAKRLGTSQPALSRMLSNLESRLGIALFERESRPFLPSETGMKLADQGRAVKAARMRAFEEVTLGALGMSGDLKIGAPPFLCERLMGDVVCAFMAQRPNITVHLIPEYFPQLERMALLNQLDVVICPIKLVVATKAELRVEPLFADKHIIVCRQGHPLIGKSSISALDLESMTWIGHSSQSMLKTDMATALASIGVTNLHFGFQSESSSAVLEMLRKSDFLTVLPDYALKRNFTEDGLAQLPVAFEHSPLTVGLVTLMAQSERPILTAFKEHIRQALSQKPD